MRFGDKKAELGFFSVTYSTVIGQTRCVPQVCYRLRDDIRDTVAKMAEEGLAKIYDAEVRFISGAAVPLKKPEAVSGKSVKHELVMTARRGGKTGKIGRKDFE